VLEPLDPRILDAEALRKINPDLLTLFNVNTPQDVARAERIAYGDVS
jgi:GTP:adenosylcobinamide-phosphate guanylyltransferase